MTLLLEAGAEVNARSSFGGYTALMWASYSYEADPRIVELLLEKGADPSVKGEDGLTALDLALRRGDREVAKLLEAFPRKNPPAEGQE